MSQRESIDDSDWKRYEGYVEEIFSAFGLDRTVPGTENTPRRWLEALRDSTIGYDGDPKLLTLFPSEYEKREVPRSAQIVEGPISFHALCEHHALPFHGTAYVAYIANAEIIGISKLTRLVRVFARRFTVQERIGEQVVDALEDYLRPYGAAVRLDAQHSCTQLRGVREDSSRTVTTSWRGAYETDANLRREFLDEARARRAA